MVLEHISAANHLANALGVKASASRIGMRVQHPEYEITVQFSADFPGQAAVYMNSASKERKGLTSKSPVAKLISHYVVTHEGTVQRIQRNASGRHTKMKSTGVNSDHEPVLAHL